MLAQIPSQIESCDAAPPEDARQFRPRAFGKELHGPDLAVDAAERLPRDGRPKAVPEGGPGGSGHLQQTHVPG